MAAVYRRITRCEEVGATENCWRGCGLRRGVAPAAGISAGLVDSQTVKGANTRGLGGRLVDWTHDTPRTTLEVVHKPAEQAASRFTLTVGSNPPGLAHPLPPAGPRLRTPPGRLRPLAAITRMTGSTTRPTNHPT